MIIGTAGHVDHGKTALIKCLTGIDTDALKEEKARGLTIEPGFAYPQGPEGVELGFIDVPGHEKFIHNMLAGVGGIDGALLVVACDDGIMPQSVEHLAILRLLSIPVRAVALTKCDLVDADLIEQRRLELADWLGEPAPIFALSSRSGEGIEALRDWLWQCASRWRARPAPGRFRLAVDRAFVKTGAGLVVTGTVVDGEVEEGAQLWLFPAQESARVRGLRRQNRPAERARRGDRCALNLAGVERSEIQRGGWVVEASEPPEGHERLDIDLRLLDDLDRPLAHWTPVHVHLGAAHLTGRVGLLEGSELAPGGRALAQLTLDQPVLACCADRLVIRSHGADRTLGGGRVLDRHPPRRGARRAERLAWLGILRRALDHGATESAEGFDPALTALAELQGEGIELAPLAANLNRRMETLSLRAEALGLVIISADSETRLFAPGHLAALEQRLCEVVAANHQLEPAAAGTERERLRRQAAPRLASPIFRQLLERLLAQGRLVSHGPFIAEPGHRARLGEEDEALWQRIAPLLDESFDPPRVRDIAQSQGLAEQRVREVLSASARLGALYQVRKDHFYPLATIQTLAEIVLAIEAEHGSILAREYRDRTQVGRKLAIQQLEFFDRIGFTRRVRDVHRIRRPDMWH
ncbi:selenocysteine-specific translation elongation factor [Halotalea alkalilenta]|uniref:selenocysteine-specific translation elongation factor n=1 Tax=Halotalea alkalilenta TaxID=376489 RepID=UPI0004829260|nr:selenocysteine-specific translation elongation factor [Halotalea alkalilenta]